eukprot:gene7087-5099_t
MTKSKKKKKREEREKQSLRFPNLKWTRDPATSAAATAALGVADPGHALQHGQGAEGRPTAGAALLFRAAEFGVRGILAEILQSVLNRGDVHHARNPNACLMERIKDTRWRYEQVPPPRGAVGLDVDLTTKSGKPVSAELRELRLQAAMRRAEQQNWEGAARACT